MEMRCKICNAESEEFSRGRILDKYGITYFRCLNCGFIQTENPYWLNEAYSDAIANSDIGIISRNVYFANIVSSILKVCFKDKYNFLDYGAGYGIFVRMMRDKGFEYRWYDKFCKNLFALDFIGDLKKQYDLLTAFELFEHFDNPMMEIEDMFSVSPNIIFSTTLLPIPTPYPSEWWYFSLNSGQHISFYTKKSLNIIAEKYHKHYIGFNNIHIFSGNKIPILKLWVAIKFASLINKVIKYDSLIQKDYKSITGIELK